MKFGYSITCANGREFKRLFRVSVFEFELLGFYGMTIVASVNNMQAMKAFTPKVHIPNPKIIAMGFAFYGEQLVRNILFLI